MKKRPQELENERESRLEKLREIMARKLPQETEDEIETVI
jgi:hypothetical protein